MYNKRRLEFKKLLYAEHPLIIIGVHNPISAKLAERAGWKALWSSSFGFSTIQAIPDANLLTFTENLDQIRKIIHQTSLPLISDCDAGYGSLSILTRVIKEYEQAGVTGICIEDNVFPKKSSLYKLRKNQDLTSIQEHVSKIKLSLKTRKDKNFIIIARTEAFVAGLGITEAIKRAKAYSEAGADAIFIHSIKTDPHEIMEFGKKWKLNTPLIAVPTTYYTVSPTKLYQSGYRGVIYANQLVRASILSMESLLEEMKDEHKRVNSFQRKIADLDKIFDITGVEELHSN